MPEALDHRSFAEGALTRLLLRVPASLLAQIDAHRARLQEDYPRVAATTGRATAARPPPGPALRRDQRERHRAAHSDPRGPAFAPARFSGQAAATCPAAWRALSRPRSAERSEGSLDRRSPPRRYNFVPPGWAGLSLPPGRPLGGSGGAGTVRSERKPRGVCGWSPSTGTARGWAGGSNLEWAPPAASGSRPGCSARRATRLTRSAPPLGCRGVLPLTLQRDAWQPSARRGQPSGDGVSAAALTGPPTAALTGRAASRAKRRWRHTTVPLGGRMGQSKEPEPRGGSLRRPTGGRKRCRRAPRAAQRKPLPRLQREHGDQRPTVVRSRALMPWTRPGCQLFPRRSPARGRWGRCWMGTSGRQRKRPMPPADLPAPARLPTPCRP